MKFLRSVLYLISVVLLCALTFMISVYVKKEGGVGETVFKGQTSYRLDESFIEDHKYYTNSFDLHIDRSREYFLTADITIRNDAGFATFFVFEKSDGTVYCPTFTPGSYSFKDFVYLDEGDYTFTVMFVSNRETALLLNDRYGFDSEDDFLEKIDGLDIGHYTYKIPETTVSIKLNNKLNFTRQQQLTTVLVGFVSLLSAFLLYLAARKNRDGFRYRLGALGLRYYLMMSVVIAFQVLISVAFNIAAPEVKDRLGPIFNLVLIMIPFDCFGFLTLLFLTKDIKPFTIPKKKLGLPGFLLAVSVMCIMCGTGSVVGNLISNLFVGPYAGNAVTLTDLLTGSDIRLRVIVIGICAPVIEELVFRKILIDRMIGYGEFAAIALSGFMFGMYHGNFMQFFYACLIGFLFAYIYVKTGRVIYSVILHMILNLSSTIITVTLAEQLASDPGGTGAVLYRVWMGFLVVIAFTGLVLFVIFLCNGKFALRRREAEIQKGEFIRMIFKDPYMLLYLLGCAGLFVMSYLPTQMT